MADTKITALPAASGVTADDLIPIVNDPAGTPATQKATAAQVATYVLGSDAEIAALAGLTSAADKGIQFTGSGTAATYDLTAAGKALLDDAEASNQRTTLGLGTIATQDADNVSISGGSVTGITDLALADGGTGASLADPGADRILFWDDSAGANTWLTAGSGLTITDTTMTASGGAPTDAKYLTTAANGSLSAEIVIPGLAGSADVIGVGGAGTAREFESGDTAPTWTPSSPTASDVGTTIASHYYAKTTDSTERLALYSWAPAGAFDARAKLAVAVTTADSDNGAFGIIITDSGNSNRALLQISTDATNRRYAIGALTYAGGSYTARGSSFYLYAQNGAYVRITRDGSNNVSFYWSTNGLIWQFIATQAFTFTVANIGFRLAGPASQTTEGIADWLRTDV